MSYYSKKNYKLLGFRKSERQNKKYYALLENKLNKNLIKIHFGDPNFFHYKDTTGLSDYKHLDHGDKERRRLYIARHKKDIKDGYYSAGFFSMTKLWN